MRAEPAHVGVRHPSPKTRASASSSAWMNGVLLSLKTCGFEQLLIAQIGLLDKIAPDPVTEREDLIAVVAQRLLRLHE